MLRIESSVLSFKLSDFIKIFNKHCHLKMLKIFFGKITRFTVNNLLLFTGGQDTNPHLPPGQILVSSGPPGLTPPSQIFVSSGPPSGQLVTVIHSSGPTQSGSPAPVLVGQVSTYSSLEF